MNVQNASKYELIALYLNMYGFLQEKKKEAKDKDKEKAEPNKEEELDHQAVSRKDSNVSNTSKDSISDASLEGSTDGGTARSSRSVSATSDTLVETTHIKTPKSEEDPASSPEM